MACDEKLVARIRRALASRSETTDRRMFGGACFTLRGNMLVGVVGDELMVRVGPDAYAEALTQPHVREMNFTGRAMKGYVFVGKAGIKTDAALKKWLDAGLAFVEELPAKVKK